MGYYFPNVDPLYLYKRQGTAEDPFIPLQQDLTVKYTRVTLKEIPDFTTKVTVTDPNNITLTEVTTDTLQEQQYRVDYSTGNVYFHASAENIKMHFSYLGTGYVNVGANRLIIDTSDTNGESLTVQDILDEQGNIGERLTQANQDMQNIENEIQQNQIITEQEIGDLSDLQTTAKDTIVNAINENVDNINKINEDMGDLTGLQTEAKDNLVDSINEQETKIANILQKNNNNWFDVKIDFGAIGDGVTDDTEKIQNAFNYARDNGSVKLYFPEGTYLISGTNGIRLYKNTEASGHINTVIKRVGSGTKMFMNGEAGNSNYASGYNGEGNIHFKGITFDLNTTDSNFDSTATTSAFDLGHGENISFTNVKVINGQNGHYFQVTGCKNVKFKNCWFGNVRYTNTSANTYELLQIEAISNASFPTFGSYDITPSRDIIIEDCTFDTVIRAIGTHGDGKYGTDNIVFCENIIIKDSVFRNSFDHMFNFTAYKGLKLENNLIDGSQGFGMLLLNVEDSVFKDNKFINIQKAGLSATSSNNNKFRGNYWKETALTTTSAYSALRLYTCVGNTFENETVTSATPNYAYAVYFSDGCSGNKIISHNFTKGKTSTISGADGTEITNYQLGNGQVVLFDGDIGTITAPVTLPHDIRNFNYLIIMGNDNSSATAQMVSMVIPKVAILTGTGSRFRLICDDSSASDKIDFSFPTATSIQADAISGTCHIRKVVGML